uniref:Mid2 domain-containing protein n=1 Tax=Mycena chlorophos TaxID=658473 RepID=A0ABQ0KWZ0_MYCCL|nr:predicted protein [Mycena chlorophos]
MSTVLLVLSLCLWPSAMARPPLSLESRFPIHRTPIFPTQNVTSALSTVSSTFAGSVASSSPLPSTVDTSSAVPSPSSGHIGAGGDPNVTGTAPANTSSSGNASPLPFIIVAIVLGILCALAVGFGIWKCRRHPTQGRRVRPISASPSERFRSAMVGRWFVWLPRARESWIAESVVEPPPPYGPRPPPYEGAAAGETTNEKDPVGDDDSEDGAAAGPSPPSPTLSTGSPSSRPASPPLMRQASSTSTASLPSPSTQSRESTLEYR